MSRDRRRRWVRDYLLAVAMAVGAWWLGPRVGWAPRLPVLLTSAVLVVAVRNVLKDTGPAWSFLMPTVADPAVEMYRGQDSRLAALRRTVADATSAEGRADPGRSAPVRLQHSLRRVAAHRITARSGESLDPENTQALAPYLHSDLAAYLCVDPPPAVDASRLSEMVRRIEQL